MSDVIKQMTDIHLFIRESGREAQIEGLIFPSMADITSDPAIYWLAQKIYEQHKNTTLDDFYVHVSHEGASFVFRGHQEFTVSGLRIFMLRKTEKELLDLNAGLLPASICRYLVHPYLVKGGLVIICGSVGQGKSTTAAATIKARLKRYGGVCLTMEDPPEFPLDGIIGKGVCYQTKVESGEIALAIKKAMRAFPAKVPAILFLGEVRDHETAAQMIRAATNGLLVILTLHVDSIESTFPRIAGLVAAPGDDQTDLMRQSLASALRLVVHQDLLRKRFTMLTNSPRNISLRNIIAQGQFKFVAQELERQRIKLAQNIDMFSGA